MDVVAEAIRRLADALDPGLDAKTQQQMTHVVRESLAGGRVVDPILPAVWHDAAVGRPQVPQEQGHLMVGQPEDLARDELFIAPLAIQAKLVEPTYDRVTLSMGERIGR